MLSNIEIAIAPLTLTIPAAVAGAAYLDGKYGISSDLNILRSAFKTTAETKYREWADRINLFYILEHNAQSRRYGDSIFMIYDNREWTYKETYKMVLKYGTWLKTKHGVKSKDIIAIDFMNSEHLVFMWWGLWSLGARPACINYNLTGQALIHCIRLSSSKLLIVEEEVEPTVSAVVRDTIGKPGFLESGESTKVEVLTPDIVADIMATTGAREPDEARGGQTLPDMAMLIYTSGTTGLPKAAVVNWGKIHAGAKFVKNWLGMVKSDRFYTVRSYCLRSDF
jgi:acyl-CoA synthetase (AMP-forming)/AMP-acid ligase II